MRAAGKGVIEVVAMLVSHLAINFNECVFTVMASRIRNMTALHAASFCGHLDVVEFLVTVPNVDVNAVGSCGVTALHVAGQYSHLEVVEFLKTVPHIEVNEPQQSGRKYQCLCQCSIL